MVELITPKEAQPLELEYHNPGEWLTDVFLEHGVTHWFGVWGGHMWCFIDPFIKRARGRFVTVRHEEQAAYMAEGYARTSLKHGVCCGTVGPGATNLVSGVHQAYWSSTPLVVVVAGHEASHDGTYTLQECYAEKFYAPFTKFSKRLTTNANFKYWFTRAFRDSHTPTRGPCLLELELVAVTDKPHFELMTMTPPNQFAYRPNWLKQPISPHYPSPDDVERAVKLIYAAERPCIFMHDGMLWADASPEMIEFCELAQVPVMGRRGGRGAVPETNPLHFKAGGVIDESDLMCLIGGKLDFYDFWGIRWKINRTLQINDDQNLIHPWLPTELAMNTHEKVTLRQMIECAKRNGYKVPEGRAKWIARVQEMEKGRRAHLEAQAQQGRSWKPIHASWMSKVMADTTEELYGGRVPVMFDSFTGSNILSPYLVARRAGQIIDSGAQAGVGHGVGQAIGTAFALREKGDNTPVMAMMGDAGMGHAMDIETAIRFNLPIVYVVFNNDVWIGAEAMAYGLKQEYYEQAPGTPKMGYFKEDLRYDEMWKALGAHGEWVTEPEALHDALVRCFKAAEGGKPAVCNVDVSRKPIQSVLDSILCTWMWRHLPWKECTNIMKEMRIKYAPFWFPGIEKYGLKLREKPYSRMFPTDEDFAITG